jgi:formate hydrogenlyase subunit 3/multisubunit Na+/H+ antiporter MnhD subunit
MLIETASLVLPPLACAWAWVLWLRRRQAPSAPKWRRVASGVALVSLTASICFGGLWWISWEYLDSASIPSNLEKFAAFTGFGLALCSVALSIFSTSRLRVALSCGSLCLLGFYYLLFLSP